MKKKIWINPVTDYLCQHWHLKPLGKDFFWYMEWGWELLLPLKRKTPCTFVKSEQHPQTELQ